MRTIIIIELIILALVITNILSGCAVLWTDHVFAATLGKRFDATQVLLIADPNYVQVGGETLKTDNDKLRFITPGLAGETE